MRIIIGSVSFYPNISGVTVSTYLLAKHLATEGHEVVVIAPAQSRRNYVEHDGALTIHRLAAIPNPFRRGFYVPYAPKRHVAQIVEQFKPDIVHLQDPLNLNIALRREAHKRNIPVIITNHFTFDYVLAYVPKILHPLMRGPLQKKLIKFYNMCDTIICPTQTVVDILKKAGVTKPVLAMSNGVDIHRFYQHIPLPAVRKRFAIPNKPIVLYLGRLDKDKSINVLLDAIPEILKKIDAHVVLAGWGDLFEKIHKDIAMRELGNHVTMTGLIPHEDQTLIGLFQLADVFVIPSTIETQSIVTMEAMAAGKPVVAAHAGALPELVKHGKNGYLFKPGDSLQLAHLTMALLQNHPLRRKMGKTSLELIADHELKKSHRLIENLYEQCLKNYRKNVTS